MWHEARKQEKFIRTVMVDVKKRAERRKDFYEKIKLDPIRFLRLYGTKSKINIDPEIAVAAENPNILMTWIGDNKTVIDRFDGRANLDGFSAKSDFKCTDRDEKLHERMCNYERYRCLVHNQFGKISELNSLNRIDLAEKYGEDITKIDRKQSKKKVTERAAIGYVYSDSDYVHNPSDSENESQDSQDSEPDLDLDLDIEINVNHLHAGQQKDLVKISQQYGMRGNDYLKLMKLDKTQEEDLRTAKILEEQKAQFHGRKSRRERKIFKEQRLRERYMKQDPKTLTFGASSFHEEIYEGKNLLTPSPKRDSKCSSSSSSSSLSPKTNRPKDTVTVMVVDTTASRNLKDFLKLPKRRSRRDTRSDDNDNDDHHHRHHHHHDDRDRDNVNKGRFILSRSRSRSRSHSRSRTRRSRSRSHGNRCSTSPTVIGPRLPFCTKTSTTTTTTMSTFNKKSTSQHHHGNNNSNNNSHGNSGERGGRENKRRKPHRDSHSRSPIHSSKFNTSTAITRNETRSSRSRFRDSKVPAMHNSHNYHFSKSRSPELLEEEILKKKYYLSSDPDEDNSSSFSSSSSSSLSANSSSRSRTRSKSRVEKSDNSSNQSIPATASHPSPFSAPAPTSNYGKGRSHHQPLPPSSSTSLSQLTLNHHHVQKSFALLDSPAPHQFKQLKFNPKDLLKRQMEIQLNRAYRADKKAEQEKQLKVEKERSDRENQLREMAFQIRKRERERRRREREKSSRSRSSSSTISTTEKRRSRSRDYSNTTNRDKINRNYRRRSSSKSYRSRSRDKLKYYR